MEGGDGGLMDATPGRHQGSAFRNRVFLENKLKKKTNKEFRCWASKHHRVDLLSGTASPWPARPSVVGFVPEEDRGQTQKNPVGGLNGDTNAQ